MFLCVEVIFAWRAAIHKQPDNAKTLPIQC
jgi:hypothetical protein